MDRDAEVTGRPAATVELSRAHHPVTVLGPGRRIGLWLQGCAVGCTGCVSRDTWAPDPRAAVPVSEIVAWCASLPADEVDGVTISGGEPFDQPAGLHALLTALHDWRADLPRDVDLLCYSGRALAVLRERHPATLALLDAVIPGPFVAARAGDAKLWRGSGNQDLVPLTDLGHRRYDAHVDAAPTDRRLQVQVDEESIWYIGIPGPGDMERVDEALARRGVRQGGVSWRS